MMNLGMEARGMRMYSLHAIPAQIKVVEIEGGEAGAWSRDDAV
jgi:hypothetical protein